MPQGPGEVFPVGNGWTWMEMVGSGLHFRLGMFASRQLSRLDLAPSVVDVSAPSTGGEMCGLSKRRQAMRVCQTRIARIADSRIYGSLNRENDDQWSA